ncbi:MAG: sulfatase [Reichenbachiella sp.]
MKTRWFIPFILIFILSSCVSVDQPNILWINADDLGAELGCYGNLDVKTPNIDGLAKSGVQFTNAYANSPVCSSSRSSLITGMYPVSINCQNHRTIDMTALPEGVLPITEYFKNAGYFCTNSSGLDMSKSGKKDFNFLHNDIFDGIDWNEREEGQPFFAQVQIKYPHRVFRKDTINPIDPSKVTLPASYIDHSLIRSDWANYLESVQHCDKIVGKILQRLEDEGLADNTIIFFFGDHGRPHLRDKQFLYEGGLKIPLIVYNPFLSTDLNINKQLVSLVDVAATSLNLASIEKPKHIQGKVFQGKNIEERKFVFGFRQRAGDAVDDIRSITDGAYKLIWNRMPSVPWMQLSGYKKSQYPAFTLYKILHESGDLGAPYDQFMADSKPEIELYDLKKDPSEFDNLAEDDRYQNIRNVLLNVLKSNLAAFEKGMITESAEAIEKAKRGSRKYFEKQMQSKGLDPNASDEDILEYWEGLLLE